MKHDLAHRIWMAVGIVLCIILIPLLILNLILMVKRDTVKDKIPGVLGYLALVVQSDDMAPQIQRGDLILCKEVSPRQIAEGDIIAYYDPTGVDGTVSTRQVAKIENTVEGRYFTTEGIAENRKGRERVPESCLAGVFCLRLAGAGRAAMFLQTTGGILVCVVLPLGLWLAWDFWDSRSKERRRNRDIEHLLKKLHEFQNQSTRGSTG